MRHTIMLLLVAVTTAYMAGAQSVTFPHAAHFKTNVYLHDAPEIPLHSRVPTGEVARIDSGVLYPVGNVAVRGALTVETNASIMLPYKPDVAAVSNGVIVRANGEIELNRFVTGEGYYTAVVNPTNPLPLAMIPSLASLYLSASTFSAWTNAHATSDHVTNYVDRTSLQTIQGAKTFTGATTNTSGRMVLGSATAPTSLLLFGDGGDNVLITLDGDSFEYGGNIIFSPDGIEINAMTNILSASPNGLLTGYYGYWNASGLTNIPLSAIVGGVTVTQRFLDASSGVRTNIYINGILTTGYTE